MNVHVAVPDLFWPDAARAHETRGDRLPALAWSDWTGTRYWNAYLQNRTSVFDERLVVTLGVGYGALAALVAVGGASLVLADHATAHRSLLLRTLAILATVLGRTAKARAPRADGGQTFMAAALRVRWSSC